MIIFSLDKILKYFGMIKADWVYLNQFQWIIIIIRFYSDVKRGLKNYIKNMKSSFDTIVDYIYFALAKQMYIVVRISKIHSNVQSFLYETLQRLLIVCHKKTYQISWIVCYSDLKFINVHKNARQISWNGVSIFHTRKEHICYLVVE